MNMRNTFWASLLIIIVTVTAGLFIYAKVTPVTANVTPSSSRTAEPERTDGTQSGGRLRFYAVDVGQGDCSLFILPNGTTILIDTGTEEESAGLPRFLRKAGVKKIDLLVATHPHADHIGGMKRIIESFPVGRVWDSGFVFGSATQRGFYAAIKEHGIPFGLPKRGFKETIGDVQIEVIAPAEELRDTGSDVNNNCLVLLISYGDVSFLITGDMELVQKRTVEPLPRCTVLQAPHHGSSNATDARLLNETRPKAVVLTYAHGNPYGHPHREVVGLLRARPEILRFDTADGTLLFETDGEKLFYSEERTVKAK